ncbi:MAG TPA: hypothetical protein VGM17_18255 [Rhizomicrobium sp.]|jgi:hypothetical protein
MREIPPSRVRVLSHEAISKTEVRLTLEVVIDVDRLAEIGQDFLSAAVKQMRNKPPPQK